MPNILKTGGVRLSDDVVKIKDAMPSRPRPKQEPLAPPPAGPMGDDAESEAFQSIEDENWEPLVEEAHDSVSGEIIQSAMAEASRILEDAIKNADNVRAEALASVQDEADRLRQEAMEQGHREGFAAVAADVQEMANGLEAAIARFEGDKAGFEAEYEENLKWLALEISSKVLAKKVAENDADMLEMVDKAVQGVRNEPWVRVEVAQEMVRLIDRLTALYDGQEGIDVSAIPAAPGTVHIETPSGMVDASLQTQLSNLREYFDSNLTGNV